MRVAIGPTFRQFVTKKTMQQPPRTDELSTTGQELPEASCDLGRPDAVEEATAVAVTRPDEQLLISATPFEVRLAIMAQGQLQELHITPTGSDSHVGTVALGKVLRVLPGMQAAFVELGLARPGFLHARDIERPLVANDGAMVDARDIRKLVHEGQVLPVQVLKDPISNKGARLTTNLALPSRFLVLTPDSPHIGISQRITDDSERDRLREVAGDCARQVGLPVDHGLIVRTAAIGATAVEFMDDLQILLSLWRQLEEVRPAAKTGDALFVDLPNHIRVLRDLVGPQTRLICIDDAHTYESVVRFSQTTMPDYQYPIKRAKEGQPLFERLGVEAQIRAALKPRVSLPSGGYLVVEQTEAMVTIDVNTGGFTGSHSLEETVYITNLEAARELPRQFRLRNLGGLIVIDFIDMESEQNQDAVFNALRDGCKTDSARVRLSRMSEFGLVELSRKRTRESLTRQLCEPCPDCQGLGVTLRPQVVAFEIMRALHRLRDRTDSLPVQEYLIVATDQVIDRLLGEDAEHLSSITQDLPAPVRLQRDANAAVDHWELIERPAQAR